MILIDETKLDYGTIYHIGSVLGIGKPPGINDIVEFENYVEEVLDELRYKGEPQ